MTTSGTLTAVLRTLTVSYPVPFLCSLLLAYALAAFTAASLAPSNVALVAATTAAISFVAALTLIGYAVLRRPELLRSERHTIRQQLVDIMGDSEVRRDIRAMAATALHGDLGDVRPKDSADRLASAVKALRKPTDG